MTIQRGAEHPHEVWLLGACALIGVAGLTTPARSGAISESFPGPLSLFWYVGLVFGSAIGTYGLLRGDLLGLLVERAGLVVLSGLCFAYGAGAIFFAGWGGVPVSCMVAGFGAANIARSRQIRRDVDRVKAAAKRPRPADPPPLAEAGGPGS